MEVNCHKTSSVVSIGRVDLAPLRLKMKQLRAMDWDTEEDFEANYNKGKGALNATQHIILKFSDKQTSPFQYFELSRWKDWKEVVEPIMNQSTKHFGYANGYFPRVMFAKLPPKSFITPHTDGTNAGSIPHKIHIPIQTNESSYFYVEDEKFHLNEGVAYEVNNAVKHSVVNNGKTDRIHLIFEYLDFDAQPEIIQKQMKNQSKKNE